MVGVLLAFLALSSVSTASKQKVLNSGERSPNFIQSSIYGQTLDIASLPEPVTLPPSYQARDYDDNYEYAGLDTFAHLEFTQCMKAESSGTFDIGIVGHPFDLGVSYRPGARFGPNGARQGARRLSPAAGWE